MQHDWIKSTLGHGERMCSRCFITNREADAIGAFTCDVPPPAPTAGNDNVVTLPVVRIERCEDDDVDEDGIDPGEDCGRWDQSAPGGMSKFCRLAGTEQCDWECPIGLSRS